MNSTMKTPSPPWIPNQLEACTENSGLAIQDMIDGNVAQNEALDALITLPLSEILGLSKSLQEQALECMKTQQECHSTPVSTPLDDIPTVAFDDFKEFDMSKSATTTSAHKYPQEELDDNTVYYCLALKIQVRRQVTGGATKHAEFQFLSSFKSACTDNTIFSVLFCTVNTPTRVLSPLSASHKVQDPLACATNTTTFTIDSNHGRRIINDLSRRATLEEIPNTDAKEPSSYNSHKLPSNGQVIHCKNLSNIDPLVPHSTSSILLGFSRLVSLSLLHFPVLPSCSAELPQMIPQCHSGKDSIN